MYTLIWHYHGEWRTLAEGVTDVEGDYLIARVRTLFVGKAVYKQPYKNS